MNWDEAKLFLAVARAGQIAGAATSLGINQSTLSRRIASLEMSLGAKLLIRQTYGCELTEEGKKFFQTMERAEGIISQGQSDLKKSDFKPSGIVRLGAPDGFGLSFLSGKLVILLDEYPNLKIQLVPIPRSISLSQHEADMAIMVGRPQKGRLITKKLTDYKLSLYASKSYIKNYGLPETTASFSNHRLIGYVDDLLYSDSLNFTNEYLRNWTSSLEVTAVMGQLEAIKSGAGIGILPNYMVKNADNLVRLYPKPIIRQYWLAWHESQKDIERIKIVARFLTQIVKTVEF